MKNRCEWAGADPLYVRYHDREWGVPVYNDRKLFEMLILEGAQAGLSWITILRKRANYRRAFDGFDANKIARYGHNRIKELLADPGIVRNRLKVEAAVGNARAFLEVKETHGRFSTFVWQFVDGQPVINNWPSLRQVPAQTPASGALSKALKTHGFKFVGPTVCYAFMQATGMVNDHITGCFRHFELSRR